jgi:hypothetical protein
VTELANCVGCFPDGSTAFLDCSDGGIKSTIDIEIKQCALIGWLNFFALENTTGDFPLFVRHYRNAGKFLRNIYSEYFRVEIHGPLQIRSRDVKPSDTISHFFIRLFVSIGQ